MTDSDGSNVGWNAAPEGNPPSHLYGFRYRDRRVYTRLRESRLDVCFRLKSGGPGTKGYYVPPSDDAGQQLFDRLVASAHPYGTVLRPHVILAGWTWVETEQVRG